MTKTKLFKFNPIRLIEEVKKRPGLYSLEQPTDREQKLKLWKEVGAALYEDWASFNKAAAYDRILTLQRKWRSLRDAYSRELRLRNSGNRSNRRVYIYFKRLTFLGGFKEEALSDEDPDPADDLSYIEEQTDPLEKTKPKKVKRRKRKKSSSHSSQSHHEDPEMAVYPEPTPAEDGESDKLFLMSFLPEMKGLPLNIKMWARTRIANVMQEAVSYHYTNTTPRDNSSIHVKTQDTSL